MEYNFKNIEAKWKNYWQENNSYKVTNDSTKPKYYVLDMFPYPSGSGLHVGHPLGYIATDIYSRYKRLCGYNVLHPMGFDSFGLPAEQYALETGKHPAVTTEENIAQYVKQLNNIGFCFDWDRSFRTNDPDYYKWTQWIFGQLFEAWYNPATNKAEPISTLVTLLNNNYDGINNWSKLTLLEQEDILMQYRLAYKSNSMVNWCDALKTVLANDEVINGVSERGGHPVEKKLMRQWFLRITKFADRLLEGLSTIDYPESLKEMQRNWIGKSKGASLVFNVENNNKTIEVFTTRPDTIFGVDFLVLAPELELVKEITSTTQKGEIENYISYVKSKSDIDRMADKKITGCFTGAYAIHPFTNKHIPIWISEYVLAGYGTGAIMAVPAGDERDFKFAQYFNITITNIFSNYDLANGACTSKEISLTNSDFLNNLKGEEAIQTALKAIEAKKIGAQKITYRFRDAGFSRQRYWGEPFPIVYQNGVTKLTRELPVILPAVDTYSPGPNGKGPLANLTEWVTSSEGERETDTMPGYAGSSWYFLRYMDPKNTQTFASKEATSYWNQVDVYVGGAEHAVGHLLYSRMWTKALYDLGYINFDEPFKKVINQGMIQGSSRLVYREKGTNHFISAGLKDNFNTDPIHVDVNMVDDIFLDLEAFKNWRVDFANATFELEEGKYKCGLQIEKMSKRLFNVVNPDDIINQYGADTFRMYEMFLGPIDMSKPWDTKGIEGVARFLKKLWRLFYVDDSLLVTNEAATKEELKVLHKHIKKINYDMEQFAFNTSVSQFMIVTNELASLKCNKKEILEQLVITLAPFAPHMAEELYAALGNKVSVLDATFPTVNEAFLVEDNFNYTVAINGKARSEISLPTYTTAEEAEPLVLALEKVKQHLEGKPIKKFIFVKGKMINLVI